MHRLRESQVCSQFPEPALEYLDLVTGDERPLGDELEECLQQIQSAASQMENDPRFQTLRDVLRG